MNDLFGFLFRLLYGGFPHIRHLLFQHHHLKNGIHEINNQEGDGKTKGIGFVQEHIGNQKNEAGENLDDSRQIVIGNEAVLRLPFFIPQHNIDGEKRYNAEKQHDKRQCGGSVIGAQPLEKNRQSSHHGGEHQYSEREFLNGYLLTHVSVYSLETMF